MSLKQIEQQVAQLSAAELKEFSGWFDAYMADEWDKRIESDVQAGKFDKLFSEIEAEAGRGELQPL